MEPTKVCSRCGKRKPWSGFYSYYRNGEARPLSRCKPCDKAYREEWAARNREKVLAYRRDYYARVKADPEHYAARLEAGRTWKRRRRGTKPESHRTSRLMRDVDLGPARLLPVGPFASWLRELGIEPGEVARRAGIDDSSAYRLFHAKQPLVSVVTVDRVCLALGESIETLYKDL